MHPNKHIRKALKYAIENDWIFQKSRGHAFGTIYCKYGHRRCRMQIWSTPVSPENHAKAIRKKVDSCQEEME